MQKGVKTSVHRRGSSIRVVHMVGAQEESLNCCADVVQGKWSAHVRVTRWFESVDKRKAKVETPFPVRVLVFPSLPIGRESILTCLDTYSDRFLLKTILSPSPFWYLATATLFSSPDFRM
ncbi:hypothetical protein CEXT_294921 [Caerostris extrusa]|uniref:Uncharacterized protein n=1 Tax=Caerostris extrusa TaxID=172846 RepID=A0AAV4RST7_CAEEX|nr:hypothetical protein CEXT_294921 [Caerostris extrusa]